MPSLDSAPTCPWKSSEPMPGVLQKAIQAVYELHDRLTGRISSKRAIDFSHVNQALGGLENALLDCKLSFQCGYLPPVLTALESLLTLDSFHVDFSDSMTHLKGIADFLNGIFLDTHRNELLGGLQIRIRELVRTINIIVARFEIVRRLEQSPIVVSDNPDRQEDDLATRVLRNYLAEERATGQRVTLN